MRRTCALTNHVRTRGVVTHLESLIYKRYLFLQTVCRVADDWPTAIDLSRDHKPTDEKEKVRVEKAGGYIHQDRIDGVREFASHWFFFEIQLLITRFLSVLRSVHIQRIVWMFHHSITTTPLSLLRDHSPVCILLALGCFLSRGCFASDGII